MFLSPNPIIFVILGSVWWIDFSPHLGLCFPADNFGLDGWHYTFYFVGCYIFFYYKRRILELCSWMQLSFLGTFWSFLALLLRFVGGSRATCCLELVLPHHWGKIFSRILTDAPQILRASFVAAGVRHSFQPCVLGTLFSCMLLGGSFPILTWVTESMQPFPVKWNGRGPLSTSIPALAQQTGSHRGQVGRVCTAQSWWVLFTENGTSLKEAELRNKEKESPVSGLMVWASGSSCARGHEAPVFLDPLWAGSSVPCHEKPPPWHTERWLWRIGEKEESELQPRGWGLWEACEEEGVRLAVGRCLEFTKGLPTPDHPSSSNHWPHQMGFVVMKRSCKV